MDMMNVYREKLLDHYHHPRNVGQIERPDFAAEESNQSCGDQIHIEGKIAGNRLKEVMFMGTGCVISQAAASLLTEYCKGKITQEVLSLNKDFMLNLIGIPLGPTRLRCAMLPLYALQHGIENYQKEQEDADLSAIE
jgi:nitrogen fixation protein NifU and related proteins